MKIMFVKTNYAEIMLAQSKPSEGARERRSSETSGLPEASATSGTSCAGSCVGFWKSARLAATLLPHALTNSNTIAYPLKPSTRNCTANYTFSWSKHVSSFVKKPLSSTNTIWKGACSGPFLVPVSEEMPSNSRLPARV